MLGRYRAAFHSILAAAYSTSPNGVLMDVRNHVITKRTRSSQDPMAMVVQLNAQLIPRAFITTFLRLRAKELPPSIVPLPPAIEAIQISWGRDTLSKSFGKWLRGKSFLRATKEGMSLTLVIAARGIPHASNPGTGMSLTQLSWVALRGQWGATADGKKVSMLARRGVVINALGVSVQSVASLLLDAGPNSSAS